jgi:threonine/homoserine/homoserine lactone efflux protein
MTWHSYGTFVVFAIVLILVPGPDFAVVTKNALSGGRRRGSWAAVGVTTSNAVQGLVAALGLGALVVAAEPVFLAVKVAGAAYLLVLAVQAFRSAVRGRYEQPDADEGGGTAKPALSGWRQGFLSNITNPKVLVFYLAVLPQFLTRDAALWQVLALALTHAVLGLVYLLLLVGVLHGLRTWLVRRRVRRTLDALTGTALLAFGARLAAEST